MIARRCRLLAPALAVLVLDAASAPAQTPPLLTLQRLGGTDAPVTITLMDALERAKANDAQFLAAAADAQIAKDDRVQAHAAMLPAISNTTQYLGTQGDTPLPSGRFVSNDGVNLYRFWLVGRQDLSPDTLTATPLHRAEAAERLAAARLEVARRGLAVTVTERYYALVTAERQYANAQQAMQQAQRFFEIASEQQRLGQVARADVVRAEIQNRQAQDAFREAMRLMAEARLTLAVLLFPTLNENFTVVDDLTSAPPLPDFPEIRRMAEHENPDVRAASEALRVADHTVSEAKHAFLPTLTVEADYGIEANEFALHSVAAAEPQFGEVPNLGYFVTVSLNLPIWDWGGLRAKLRQSETRQTQARTELSQTNRLVMSRLFISYNEAQTARAAADSTKQIEDLAAESLRLTTLRYQAGESSALEVVDAQNTLTQARTGYDAALTRYRVALANLQTLTGSF